MTLNATSNTASSSNAPTLALPALRVLAPMAAGIAIHHFDRQCPSWLPLALLAIASAAYILLHLLSRSPQGRLRLRPWFIVPLATVALSLGWLTSAIHCPACLTTDQTTGRVLTGRIASLDFTDFSTRMEVDILDNDLPPCRVLLSTRGCDYTLQAGDLIVWPARLNEVGTLGNPDEMDYASYMLDSRGIRYQQHLPVSQLKRVGHFPTLLTRMECIRRHLALKVFNSNLSPGAQQFVTALFLGDNGNIDKATRQEFATAGIAHILALSGLHVGLVAFLIWLLLFPLDYLRLKKLRLALTLLAITVFAIFTGLSPSVVRATVMTGMVFASFILYRRSSPLNALALAALLILIFSPSALFSVGFQLSFVTVAALLIFARVPQPLMSRYRWVNALTATILTSIVAMLATMALSAHYFHTISLMSVLANLLVLPVMPIFMVLGALFLLVTTAGLQWSILDWAVDSIYRYIYSAATFVGNIPMSHIDGVYVSTTGVVICFIIMALVTLWLYRHSYRYLLAAGVALALLLGHSLWVDAHTTHKGLVVFNSYTSTPVFYYDHGTGYLWIPDDDEPDLAAFSRYHAGFLARHGINALHLVTSGDTLRLGDAMISPPWAYLMGRRMLAVGSGQSKPSATPHDGLSLDAIIVTRTYHGTAATLERRYPGVDTLIISGAHFAREAVIKSHSPGIGLHDLSSQGAMVF